MEEKRVKQHHLPRSIKRILFLLCILLSSAANLSRYLYKNRVSMSKIKDVEISSWIIPLPFQNVAIKTHARSFCATLQPAQPLKSDWNPGTTTPMIRLPLKLDWKPSFKLWKQMQHMLNLNHNVPQIMSPCIQHPVVKCCKLSFLSRTEGRAAPQNQNETTSNIYPEGKWQCGSKLHS